MKFVDEFRDPAAARRVVAAILSRATRRWTIMEVCGGQTHNLLRYGIDEAVAEAIELVHGPGCPVCVTAASAIDRAIELARRPEICLATFGDMLRVPGSRASLAQARAQGARVLPFYAPGDALRHAQRHPEQQVVFFAVGFETTAPATALAILQAERLGVANFSVLSAHVRVQPAMAALRAMPETRLDGFLAAGHVCTVMGYDSYRDFAVRYRTPVVVTGFEPLDLLHGLQTCVDLLERGVAEVRNAYGRSVTPAGNRAAQQWVDEVFEPCDRWWRGFGVLADGGLGLRSRWRAFDAEQRFGGATGVAAEGAECQAGLVLAGQIKPPQCPHFGARCTPDQPLGAPMVSSEGACAAYYLYHPVPNSASSR